MAPRTNRLALCLGIGSLTLASFLYACASDDSTESPDTSGADGGPKGLPDEKKGDASAADSGDGDAGDTADEQRYGPAAEGDECDLNYDCQEGLRCECEDGDCACAPGARGTGKNGVDPCPSGNEDCASGVCIERSAAETICSDACESDADCGGKLPKCLMVFGLPFDVCSPPPVN